MPLSPRLLGIIQVILSGVCFGFLGVFGRWAFEKGITPPELLGHRFLLAACMLGILCSFKYGVQSLKVGWVKAARFLTLGILGYAVFSSFYFIAIQKLSITLAVLLLYTFPIWVTLGAWLFYKEKLNLVQALTIPLAFAGLILLIGTDWSVKQSTGLLYGLGSAITYAIYILLSRMWLENQNAFVAVFFIQLGAGGILFLKSFESWERTNAVIEIGAPMILGLAFICSVLAMSLFQAGLQKLQSWEASILSTTEPLVGITLATIFFQEKLTALQLFGASLVLLAFVLISNPRLVSRRN